MGREREKKRGWGIENCVREGMNANVIKGSFVVGNDIFFKIILILTCYRVLFFQFHL